MIGFLFLQIFLNLKCNFLNLIYIANLSKSYSFHLYLSLTSFHESLCYLKTQSLRLDRCG